MSGSLNDFTKLNELSNMSILRFGLSSAAYRKACLEALTAMASPVYMAPALDLSAGVRVATLTWVVGLVGSTVGFQALMVPSRVAKIKTAAPDLLFSVMV